MPTIMHRLTIDASPQEVAELITTPEGIARWWTAQPVQGGASAGEDLALFFAASERPAATLSVLQSDEERIVWRCLQGPAEWQETRVVFSLHRRADGGTTLLFRHEGWREESEFMSGCATNWGAYLCSLKSGAEGGAFAPFPAGEISRWD